MGQIPRSTERISSCYKSHRSYAKVHLRKRFKLRAYANLHFKTAKHRKVYRYPNCAIIHHVRKKTYSYP